MRVLGNVLLLVLSMHASAFERKVSADCEKRPPEHLTFAKLNIKYATRVRFSHRETVSYVCSPGYKGRPSVQCLNGEWMEATVKCRQIECTEPKLVKRGFAVVKGVKPTYQPGDSLEFNCIKPYILNGSARSTCGLNGRWTPLLPKCIRGSGCDKPVNINSNAHLEDKYIQLTSFVSGDHVRYTCDIGYVYEEGSRYQKCTNGKWSPLPLKCQRRSCGAAGEIINGEFVYTGAEFGDTATAVCDEGYQLVGKATRTCMNGGWNGHEPICEAMQCTEPLIQTNAERTGYPRDSYAYRSVIGYRCREGVLSGPSEIWCTNDGTWSASPPECKEIRCTFPSVPNSSRSGARVPPFKYRHTVSFTCNSGYEMFGPRTAVCGLDENWTPGLPLCIWRGK